MYNMNVERMALNSQNMGDNDFTKDISYMVEEYIHDDIPKQYEFKTLQQAIVKAYDLFLDDKLHGFGIYDKVRDRYNLTNALNYFVDTNYINILRENERLQKELSDYREFIKSYKAEEIFKEYQKPTTV